MPRELVSFFQELQSFDYVILGLSASVWLLLFYFHLQFYMRLAYYKIPSANSRQIPISILMVERNEEINLRKNIPGWLEMDDPDYELVIVDDFSEDASLPVLGLLRQKYPRLRMTCLNQETRYSQKLSRSLALKAAAYDHVVFAAPSMTAPAPSWLEALSSAFAGNKTVVVGYSGIIPGKGFYNKFFRIESFFQQIESMAMCLNGIPFVSAEENIAFIRNEFFKRNGFGNKIKEEYLHMELILNGFIERKYNQILPEASYALRKEIQIGKQEFFDLWKKSFRLKSSLRFFVRFTLKIINFLRMIWVPALVTCVILYTILWIPILFMFILFVIFQFITLKKLQNRLNEKKILLSSFLYGWIAPYIKLLAGWRFNYGRKNL